MRGLKDMDFLRSGDLVFNWENFNKKHKNPKGLSFKMEGQKSQSNGSLMRTTPLAVWCSKLENDEDVHIAVQREVGLTHQEEIVQTAVTIYVLAIRYLLNKEGLQL